MESIQNVLDVITSLITILGVPAAILLFLREQRLQREEREYGTYDALDDKYIELQKLCLDYPELDICDTRQANPKALSEVEKCREEAIILIRISIFERAFLMYKRSSSRGREAQWSGWNADMKEWLKRENFRAAWIEHRNYFDASFADHLNSYLPDSN